MIKNAFAVASDTRRCKLFYMKPSVEIYSFDMEEGFKLSTDSDLEDFDPENQI